MRKSVYSVLVGSILVFSILLAEKGHTVEKIALIAGDSFSDTLQMLEKNKKPADILLNNGQKYSGEVINVNSNFVVLKLRGNNSFSDAKIKIADISAVEVRVRDQ